MYVFVCRCVLVADVLLHIVTVKWRRWYTDNGWENGLFEVSECKWRFCWFQPADGRRVYVFLYWHFTFLIYCI